MAVIPVETPTYETPEAEIAAALEAIAWAGSELAYISNQGPLAERALAALKTLAPALALGRALLRLVPDATVERVEAVVSVGLAVERDAPPPTYPGWEPVSEPMSLECVTHNLEHCGVWSQAALLATYRQDVAWLLRERERQQAEAIAAIDALKPDPKASIPARAGFVAGINAALRVVGEVE